MCGLIGVNGTADAAREVYLGLLNLQHRGQDGAGILCVRGEQFEIQKGSGLVENVFSDQSFKSLRGEAAIGHTRYATIGKRDPNLLQPFLDYPSGIGIAHNGNIVNCYEIREELAQSMPKPLTESDSEIILQLLLYNLAGANTPALFSAIKKTMEKLVGSYAVIGLDRAGNLFAFRDPNGIRPLVMGQKKTADGRVVSAFASETVALAYLGYTDLQEVLPGEAVYIDAKGSVLKEVLVANSYSPCMFEWVYFARVESEIGGVPVYEARFQLGVLAARQLRKLGITADVVVPVPETSRAAAIAIAESMDLPYRELLIKNRYVNRTFILDGDEARQTAIQRKLFPIAGEIKGKRCLIVDDSIVRGTTASKIIKLMKQSGAKEVILVSTCPQIGNPCYYGIDFPSTGELIASLRTDAEIAEHLGADRVIFQTVDGLKQALKQESICSGCLTGVYPTDVSSGHAFQARRDQDRKHKVSSQKTE